MDTLRKGKEDVPQPLYLFVSLIAIFCLYVVVYKVFHNIRSYWLRSLGGDVQGHRSTDAPIPCWWPGTGSVCAFTPSPAPRAVRGLHPTLLSDGLLLKAETLSGTPRLCLLIPSL